LQAIESAPFERSRTSFLVYGRPNITDKSCLPYRMKRLQDRVCSLDYLHWGTVNHEEIDMIGLEHSQTGLDRFPNPAAQARRGLRNFAADLAIEHAAKQLVLTPETDKALIAEFISDVAGNGAARGGQN